MKPILWYKLPCAIGVASALVIGTSTAEAKGCLRGAAAGAVAGHYAGHHAIAGAMVGCAAVHHHYAKKAREQQSAQPRHN